MHRVFTLLLIICSSITAHADSINAFGLLVTYKLPDDNWHIFTHQEEIDKGMVLFYHEKHQFKDRDSIDPSLSIIYERLPTNIKTSRQYAEYSQTKNNIYLVGQKEIGNCVLYFHRWEAKQKNNLYRIFQVYNDVGIQYLGTATADKFEEFGPAILNFISSAATCG